MDRGVGHRCSSFPPASGSGAGDYRPKTFSEILMAFSGGSCPSETTVKLPGEPLTPSGGLSAHPATQSISSV